MAHVTEQPSNSTEARSIDKQVGIDHDVQSDSDFLHDGDSSATEISGA